MRKAGGIVALIAGIFCVLSSFFALVAVPFVTALADKPSKPIDATSLFWGGLFVSAFVIVCASILVSTNKRWPGPVLMFGSIVAMFLGWGGGFIFICLGLAIIGSLLTLFEGKPIAT